jgi:hypothetical protein
MATDTIDREIAREGLGGWRMEYRGSQGRIYRVVGVIKAYP